ncbi:MAG: hypothetical protein WBD99_01960 [Thermodesulfobacteriota bacterium]
MFTRKMKQLPVTSEAMVFYLSNCLMQGDYIDAQQYMGVDPPKIKFYGSYANDYVRINELAERDMISILKELREIGLLSESP